MLLCEDEQAAVDASRRDGDKWSLDPQTPFIVTASLERKGLAKCEAGRWLLSPLGYMLTSQFRIRPRE
jgi:hypothetical protein